MDEDAGLKSDAETGDGDVKMAMKNFRVVMAHGGWADGSSWARVTTGLMAHGIKAVAAPLPLTDLADDVAALNRTIERMPGPVIVGECPGLC